mmetsp:Transcript_47986/g.148459  ORF Transcript_47986/g.148459 Transcript_47986/m.148459 type:complete len:198 (-) Transcript_47986:91-684(-)
MTALIAFSLKRSNIMHIDDAAARLDPAAGAASVMEPANEDPRKEELVDETLPLQLPKPPAAADCFGVVQARRALPCRRGTAAAKLATAATSNATPVPEAGLAAMLLPSTVCAAAAALPLSPTLSASLGGDWEPTGIATKAPNGPGLLHTSNVAAATAGLIHGLTPVADCLPERAEASNTGVVVATGALHVAVGATIC